jgi:hypothetical protein
MTKGVSAERAAAADCDDAGQDGDSVAGHGVREDARHLRGRRIRGSLCDRLLDQERRQDADDFWAVGPDGVKRFRSAGVVIGVSAGAVTGRVYLKHGGHYEDVYEKIAAGQWRIKTRVFMARMIVRSVRL